MLSASLTFPTLSPPSWWHVNMIFNSLLQTPWKEPEGDLQECCLGKLYLLEEEKVQPSTIWWCGPLGRTLQSASILRANYGDGEGTKIEQIPANTNKCNQIQTNITKYKQKTEYKHLIRSSTFASLIINPLCRPTGSGPRPGRQARIHFRGVHFWVFSMSHFVPWALSSNWIMVTVM